MSRSFRKPWKAVILAGMLAQSGFCQFIPAANAVVRDGSGSIFAAGTSNGFSPVTPGAYQTQYTRTACTVFLGQVNFCTTGWVGKFSASGQLAWGTYLGGTNGYDGISRLALDSHGNIWLVGYVGTQNFPITTNAYSTTRSGAFIAELSPDGSQLLYSTFTDPQLSPSSALFAYETIPLMTDQQDDLYLVNPNYALKFDPAANKVVYANSLGQPITPAGTLGKGVTATAAFVDGAGVLYVAGVESQDGPAITPGTYSHPSTGINIFLMAFDPTGANIILSTVIGGSGVDSLSALARDAEGNFYLTGTTTSSDFPLTPDAMPGATGPAFLLKLSPDASKLLYSSLLGHSNTQADVQFGARPLGPLQLKVGADGNLRMLAGTGESDVPLNPDGYQPCYAPSSFGTWRDWLYLEFSSDLRTIAYATAVPHLYPAYGPFYFDTSGHVYLANTLPDSPPYFQVLNISADPGPGPVCLADYITQATTPVAPGLLASILGPGIGPSEPASLTLDAAGRIETQLAGMQVLFGDLPAPILSAAPSRIDVVVPFGISTSGNITVSVMRNGAPVGTLTTATAPAAPKLFSVDGTGFGAAAWNQDGTPNSADNPASLGDIVTFFGTGMGTMNPVPVDGTIPQSPQSSAVLPLAILYDADVNAVLCRPTYSGDAPGLVEGIMQLNCQLTAPCFGCAVAVQASDPNYQSLNNYVLYVK